MDLRLEINRAVGRLVESGAIEKIIDKQLGETVERLLKETLSSYSDFGKQIGEALKKSLGLHGELDLPSYNHAVLAILHRQVEQSTRNVLQRQIAERMTDLLEPAPEKISLSALVESYRHQLDEEVRAGCVCYGDNRITFELTESERGFRHVLLGREKGQRKGDCDIDIGLHKRSDADLWSIYHLRFRDSNVESKLFAGPFYQFERLLFQMRVAGTLLELDEASLNGDVELNYGHHED